MDAEEVVQDLLERVTNAIDLPVLDDIVSDDVLIHGPAPFSIKGKRNIRDLISMFWNGVAAYQRQEGIGVRKDLLQVTHLFGCNEWVATRLVTWLNTQELRTRWPPRGEARGRVPGLDFDAEPMTEILIMWRVRDGLIGEVWLVSNTAWKQILE